jgi:glutamyl-tRNA reductase
MPVLQVGVSHRRASLDLLERLAIPDGDLPKAYRRLADDPDVREAVLLSTCNRVEIYADVASYHAGSIALRRFLWGVSEVSPGELAGALSTRYEGQAVEHLFLVAAGMDSMVLGEPQILGQVREAHRRAEEEGTSGPLVAAVFRAAVRAGRRVRSEAGLGAPPAAVIGAGLDEAELRLGLPLRGRPAAVVGAGRMAGLAAEALQARGAGPIHVVNRTPSRAASLAARVDGRAFGLDRLGEVLRDVEMAVLCTAAPGVVVTVGHARAALTARAAGRRQALFLIDLAVPRNADPEVRGVDGVGVADIDDLRDRLRGAGPGAPVADLQRAHAIIGEETRRFEDRQDAARLAPLIRALRASGERAAAAELRRAGPFLSRLEPEERAAVEALARSLVAKLLHTPTVRVKELSGRGRGDAAARALADLFGVEYPPGV